MTLGCSWGVVAGTETPHSGSSNVQISKGLTFQRQTFLAMMYVTSTYNHHINLQLQGSSGVQQHLWQ